ncbi:MAG: SUF system NifU family Fe-S cluster assembly protein [Elusimicrobia bacterium]|nr:SUF system NifU family Fe-S cluster assembly protein [Elusimicrobiota bacterium]
MNGDDLYREVILDHFQNPRNHGRIDPCDLEAHGVNPFCGDEIKLTVLMGANGNHHKISAIKTEANGCAISRASASMMTETLEGKTFDEAKQAIHFMRDKLLNDSSLPWPDDWFDLSSLEGVKKYPVRIKCALLAWNTLTEGLKDFEHHSAPGKISSSHQETD